MPPFRNTAERGLRKRLKNVAVDKLVKSLLFHRSNHGFKSRPQYNLWELNNW